MIQNDLQKIPSIEEIKPGASVIKHFTAVIEQHVLDTNARKQLS
jgi:hypothetical protein